MTHSLQILLLLALVITAAVIMVLVTPPLLQLTFPRRPGQRIAVEETIAGPPEETGTGNPEPRT